MKQRDVEGFFSNTFPCPFRPPHGLFEGGGGLAWHFEGPTVPSIGAAWLVTTNHGGWFSCPCRFCLNLDCGRYSWLLYSNIQIWRIFPRPYIIKDDGVVYNVQCTSTVCCTAFLSVDENPYPIGSGRFGQIQLLSTVGRIQIQLKMYPPYPTLLNSKHYTVE